MAAAEYDLVIEQGVTFELGMTYKVGDPPAAVDLTGWTAAMHIRQSPSDEVALVEFTTENGKITLGGTAGTVLVSVTDEETALYSWDRARYDLVLYSAGGAARRLLRGSVLLSRAVTHA
jgi:hypothetical protein